MSQTRPFSALVRGLPSVIPFVGPEAQERARGAPFRARLGANENLFGPSPAVKQAIAEAAGAAWMYGDPENYELRAALADHLGCGVENILIGEGIDGLLGLTARLFLDPGDRIATSIGAYPTFNFHVAAVGGVVEAVPYRDDAVDVEALAAQARAVAAKLVYLSNPDNPTGSTQSPAAIDALLAGLPERATLLLDEAYIECAADLPLPPLNLSDPRVIRFRTFSKAYGMAGVRVGYALGEASVIRAYEKIRNHFGVGRLAQSAALAAVQDQAYLHETVAKIAASRAQIADIARAAQMTPLPSAANFVAIDCGGDAAAAVAVMERMLAAGVFVRKPMAPGLDRLIRISCAPAEELALVAETLTRG
ncbi:MAG: pyridoxal phosphate-dependent aminotransferase [Neomegalonema sp.]|nr:pyridoxal phosphate-dependent aminotransferase [Neomegalonema sp.]